MVKIKIAIPASSSGHAVRGVGFYASRLLAHVKPLAVQYGIELTTSEHNYDLIHYPYFDLFKHTLPITKSVTTVVTIHDVIPLDYPKSYPPGIRGLLNFNLQQLALHSADLVLTDSYASLLAIHKHLSVSQAKLKLIHLAADPIFKPVSKPANKFNLPKKFVLYVGDINYNKNLPNLISACNKSKLPLVMVGKAASEIEQLDLSHPQLAHLKGLDLTNVIRLGFVSDTDLVTVYNLATVCCQPSFAEGFGLVILEAMACGTPVACSSIPVFEEIAGHSATYFDPYSVDDMCQALTSAKNLDGQSQAAKFSWDKTARLTLQSYLEVL